MSADSTIHALAGAVGGIFAMTATYPLVFVSTRAAVERRKEEKPTIRVFADIIRREGVVGLYSGLGSSLLGIVITNGVYYYFYERSRGAILKWRGTGKSMTTLESMLMGLIAGSATTILSNPFWVIQTSQAIRTMSDDDDAASEKPNVVIKRLGFFETVNNLISQHGFSAFWRGLRPALVLVINPILQYTIFEQLKNFLVSRRRRRLRLAGALNVAVSLLSDWDFFVLGALSKLVATTATYPYIVVKNRSYAGQSSARYKSALDGILSILKVEGISGLYRGISSKLLQSVLTAAILFAGQRRIYEITKQMVYRSV
ncbi:mitochondrial carrier [Fistulina hepatica ATCC 64428]|nr:mitochondrial carrier [Fistulina hepatica ATCC 64428]